MKSIHVSKLMELVEVVQPDLADWTVGFVKVIQVSSSKGQEGFDGVLAGSGVLITGGGRHAILTADHVIQALPDSGPIGLVLLSRRGPLDHQFILQMDYVNKVTIGRGLNEASGPDLALLVLS